MLAVHDANRELSNYLCNFFPAYPICADSRDEYKFQKKQPRRTAIAQNRWLTYNDSFLNLLIFDLDYSISLEQAWQLCIDRVGLEPTWVCITENGAHVAYALENMVQYDWTRTIEFAQRIKVAVSDVLDADVKGSHRMRGFWRNPALHINRVSYNKYSLMDFIPVLNEFDKNNLSDKDVFVDYMKLKHRTFDTDIEFRPGNRNAALWYRAMMQTNSRMSETQISKIVIDLHYQLSNALEYYPLGSREVARTARSVFKYNDENRNRISSGTRKRIHHDNAGAMQFPPMRGLSEDEYLDERVRRQSLSALRTARLKSKQTISRIKDAILRVRFLGLSMTMRNIALYAERSIGTISRYFSEGLISVDAVVSSMCSISSYIVIASRNFCVGSPVLLRFSFEKKDIGRFGVWRIVSPP